MGRLVKRWRAGVLGTWSVVAGFREVVAGAGQGGRAVWAVSGAPPLRTPRREWCRGILDNGLAAGGVVARVLTAAGVPQTARRSRRVGAERVAGPALHAAVDGAAERGGWDGQRPATGRRGGGLVRAERQEESKAASAPRRGAACRPRSSRSISSVPTTATRMAASVG